ncbi:hypothetical protein CA3LBN_001109 [Candidozyma haemuli]|uniref:Uncharacterized protein n=1 Tax=Candidozyma haemuli TaxID=45357 RepID=A0ABX8I819_9ASCO|nr:hypothetical protein CA3LBN_001109 [[Candida] haemuloni]
MWKTLVKQLNQELKLAQRKVAACQESLKYEKRKARLAYEKFRLITERKPFDNIELELANLAPGKTTSVPFDNTRAKQLLRSSNDINNLKNVVHHLRSSRVYDELLERYNPGISMSQEDNVKKTANMVGLQSEMFKMF